MNIFKVLFKNKRSKIIIWSVILLIIVVEVVSSLDLFSSEKSSIEVKTEKIGLGSISNTVTATGTLEASVTVDVGTQVSGKINNIYVDYNSLVKKGDLIAVLDTKSLESTLQSSKATLDAAEAKLKYEKAKYNKYKDLNEKQLIAQIDFDEIEYDYKNALASYQSAKAAYSTAKTNLGYAYIYAPIDGIILEKDVEEGETVAASYETPTLFTIANDLSKMEIEADVDEADIGQIKVGQRVEFTVDAYPDKTFKGVVKEIHLNPTTDSNVVTYQVIITASNPEKLLMPGMTTNVSFYVVEKRNILLVPNTAVDLHSTQLMAKPKAGDMTKTASKESEDGERHMVLVKENSTLKPVPVVLGVTDEINYEVLSGLKEGQVVVVSMETKGNDEPAGESGGEGRSPFMPGPPSHK